MKDAPVKDGPFDQRRLVSRDIIHSAHLYLNLPPAPGFLTSPPERDWTLSVSEGEGRGRMVKSAPLIAIIGSAPSARGKNQPCEGVCQSIFQVSYRSTFEKKRSPTTTLWWRTYSGFRGLIFGFVDNSITEAKHFVLSKNLEEILFSVICMFCTYCSFKRYPWGISGWDTEKGKGLFRWVFMAIKFD